MYWHHLTLIQTFIQPFTKVGVIGAESLPGSYPAVGCGRHQISLHAVAGAAAAAELRMNLQQQLMSLSAGWWSK